MATPALTCFCTASATAARIRMPRAAASTGTPSSLAYIIRIRSAGRGRLPVCVVRNPSVLRGGVMARDATTRAVRTPAGLSRGRRQASRRRLPRRAERALDLGDALFVPLVEGPLLDPLAADEPGVREDPQMLARGRLAHAELGGDEHTAHAVAHQIAVDLPGKVRARRLEPAENLQPLLVRERLRDLDRDHLRHFANWLSPCQDTAWRNSVEEGIGVG